MDMVIQTGFERISHSIIFNPAGVKNSENLVKSGHICNVKEYRTNGVSYLIIAYIIRQTTVSLPPYKVQLQIDENRHVYDVSCECVANKSEKCKHISALILYINTNESKTKTSIEQEWGRPTARKLSTEKYSKGKYFHEMFPPKAAPEVVPYEFSLEDLKDHSVFRSFIIEEKKDKSKYFIKSVISDMLNNAFTKSDEINCEACVENLFIFNEESPVYKSNTVLEDNIKYKI